MKNFTKKIFSSPLSVHVNLQNKAAHFLSPVSCGVHWAKLLFFSLQWVIEEGQWTPRIWHRPLVLQCQLIHKQASCPCSTAWGSLVPFSMKLLLINILFNIFFFALVSWSVFSSVAQLYSYPILVYPVNLKVIYYMFPVLFQVYVSVECSKSKWL